MNSEGVSKRIYNTIHHTLHCPQSSKPTSTAPSSLLLSSDQKKTTHEVIYVEVPIVFNTSEQTAKTNISIQKNGQVGQQYFVKEDEPPPQSNPEEGQKLGARKC